MEQQQPEASTTPEHKRNAGLAKINIYGGGFLVAQSSYGRSLPGPASGSLLVAPALGPHTLTPPVAHGRRTPPTLLS